MRSYFRLICAFYKMQDDIYLLNFIIISFSPKAHGTLPKAKVLVSNYMIRRHNWNCIDILFAKWFENFPKLTLKLRIYVICILNLIVSLHSFYKSLLLCYLSLQEPAWSCSQLGATFTLLPYLASSRYVSYLYHRPLWSWLHKYKRHCCIIQPSSTPLALAGGYFTAEPHVKLLKIVCIITKKYFIAKNINFIWSFSKSRSICY